MLSNVDLPTFGLPTNEIKPERMYYRLRVDDVSPRVFVLPYCRDAKYQLQEVV